MWNVFGLIDILVGLLIMHLHEQLIRTFATRVIRLEEYHSLYAG